MAQGAYMDRQQHVDKLWSSHYIVLLLVATLINVSSFMLITLLPLYMITLGGNNMAAGTLMMIFTLSALLFRPVFGGMLDTVGRRKVLLFGLISFAGFSLMLVFAHSVTIVYMLRFLQGIGLSAFSTALGTVLSDVVPHRRLTEGVGYFGITGTVASAIGPVVALYLIEVIGYTRSYIFAFGVAVVSAVFALYLNYENALEVVEITPEDGEVIPTEPAGVARKNKGPFDFIEKTSIRPCLVILFVVFPISSVFSFMPLYAIERGIEDIGLFFTTYSVVMIGTRLLGGKLTDKYGYFKVYMPTIFMTLTMFFVLAIAQGLPLVLLAAVLYGVGFGTVQPIINTVVLKLSPLDRRGAANATYYATMDIGFGLGSFAWGAISEFFGFSAVFSVCFVMVAISIVLYIFVLHRPMTRRYGQ